VLGNVTEPTSARLADDLPDPVHGWCRQHGARAIPRAELLRAITKAQRERRLVKVVVRR
jgi:hypothetical protein